MFYDAKMYPRLRNISTVQITIGAAQTEVTSSQLGNAYLDTESSGFEITIPNWTNDVTATFSIISAFGNVIFSQATLSRNATHYISTSRPLSIGSTLRITLSGVPGGTGGTVLIRPYIKCG